MNYSKAFSFIKDEKDWVSKVLIAGLLFLIPVVGPLYLVGWSLSIARNVFTKKDALLPESTHFGENIILGFKATVVSFVYCIPLYLLSLFSWFASSIAENSSSSFVSTVFIAINCLVGLGCFLLGIFISLALFTAMIRIAETNEISKALNFNEIIHTTVKNIKVLSIAFLISIAASIIASLGLVFCFIGIIFTAPYAEAIMGYVFGGLQPILAVKTEPKEIEPSNAKDAVIKTAPETILEPNPLAEENTEEIPPEA